MNRIGDPLPFWLPALLLGVPPIWALGRWISAYLSRDRWVVRLLAPGVALAIWGLAVHATSYVARSIVVGLVLATLVSSSLGIYLPRRFPAPLPLVDRAPTLAVWLSTIATTALVGSIAEHYNFHDEYGVTGHLAMAAEIGNGYYPPRNLTFPAFELSYHYAFDLLAGLFGILFRTGPVQAIDAVTVLSWAYAWMLLWKIGDRLVSSSAALLVPLFVLFGGGYPSFCTTNANTATSFLDHAAATCSRGGALNPPVFSYFFQHPWTVGIPAAAVVFLVFLQTGEEHPWARRLCLALLVLAVSFCQLTLFATLGCALVLGELALRLRLRDTVLLACLLLLSLFLATRLGGFFAPTDQGFALLPTLGIAPTWTSSILWHAWTFGLLVPLGALGILTLGRRGGIFLGGVVASLVVLNRFRYEHTWDIVKFATAAAIYLAVPAAVGLVRISRRGPSFRALATLLGVATVASPVALALALAARLDGATAAHPRSAGAMFPVPTPDEVVAIDWLRRNVRPPDVVFTPAARFRAYSHHGGIPTAYVDNAAGFPFARARLKRRETLLDQQPDDVGAYVSEGVRFFVSQTGYADVRPLTRWLASKKVVERFAVGTLKVYELTP